MDLSKVEATQKVFNEKYGVKFNIEEFSGLVFGLSDFGEGCDANEAYRSEFCELFKKAYTNFFDRKIKALDFGEMIKDFEKLVMRPFSRVLKEEEVDGAPLQYGGWNVSEYLDSVKKHLDSLPSDNGEYIRQRYNNHELRLRTLRARFEGMERNPDTQQSDIAFLEVYMREVRRVNESRTTLQWLGNLFKHSAEKKLLKRFENYVSQKNGVPYDRGDENPVISEANAISMTSITDQAKQSVDAAIEEAVRIEKENDREIINFDEIGEFEDNPLDISARIDELANIRDKGQRNKNENVL